MDDIANMVKTLDQQNISSGDDKEKEKAQAIEIKSKLKKPKKPKASHDPIFLDKIKRMKASKLSENDCAELEADIKLEHNILSQNTKESKCTITKNEVN